MENRDRFMLGRDFSEIMVFLSKWVAIIFIPIIFIVCIVHYNEPGIWLQLIYSIVFLGLFYLGQYLIYRMFCHLLGE